MSTEKPNSDNKNNRNDGTFTITGDWNAQKELLKAQFPELTDEDLHYDQGEESALLVRVEAKLNKKRGEVIGLIRSGKLAKA